MFSSPLQPRALLDSNPCGFQLPTSCLAYCRRNSLYGMSLMCVVPEASQLHVSLLCIFTSAKEYCWIPKIPDQELCSSCCQYRTPQEKVISERTVQSCQWWRQCCRTAGDISSMGYCCPRPPQWETGSVVLATLTPLASILSYCSTEMSSQLLNLDELADITREGIAEKHQQTYSLCIHCPDASLLSTSSNCYWDTYREWLVTGTL